VAKVLIADDQPDILEALRLLLKDAGLTVVQVTSPAGAEAAATREEPDVALVDMNYARDTTAGTEGFDLLSRLRRVAPDLPVIVMTAWGSVSGAVEAMKRGARDYIEKPWQNERLLAILHLQIELRNATKSLARANAESARERSQALPQIVTASPAMLPVRRLIERVAGFDANVLITGEHGTGKDLVARWLHAASIRARQPFITVNSGALADGVFESELFGHVKGAFTDAKTDRIGCFELADGGTLFLDEIGTMPVNQQAKLLRVLQSGEFQPVGSSRTRRSDVRVLSATNVDIGKEVARGAFREDLLYRLNTVEINLPPLRERVEDISALAVHFLALTSARYQKPVSRFSDMAMNLLLEHSWPGNVRELQHVVERAVLLAEDSTVEVHDLNLGRPVNSLQMLERMTLADAEAYLIRRALERTGNAASAAEALGLSRSALYRRLYALDIKASE
jgi:DNA-binding NtrC family response regulator